MPRPPRISRSLLALVFLLGTTPAGPAGAGAGPVLSVQDCAKCHKEAPRDIESGGGAHKSEVTCLDCHDGHPPEKREIIPACSRCHADGAHFQVKGCLGCHRNPHTPLEITLEGNATAACMTCHEEPGVQLRDFKSFHSTMTCNACHRRHGLVPRCLDCHEPHAPAMVQADCTRCHRAHMPLQVAYAPDLPAALCAACHEEKAALLAAGGTRHKDLGCAKCHQAKHKMVPKCADCHGVPHPAGILAKFPRCEDCHKDAHDLNHWTVARAAPAATPKP
ncbi:cytochrome C [Dissulfurirhabdus thermomarina]|uniref:Cytochrome C n=1 Tax=Dissulfurirhabdus thermomarina TaxID=1765737 RepID=A0A6N9TS58_DISTH|nr:cytochrome c3 family protein [Dissulfurirhabdus thermomarina]NDY41406.1 cytochrome C [Dissulfurirhabdus thermomarina]NMX24394.1 cytochrome C [Dissulfurirhabdus thermomarina]